MKLVIKDQSGLVLYETHAAVSIEAIVGSAIRPPQQFDAMLGMPYQPSFIQFVKAYPHERGKAPGAKAWALLNPDATLTAKLMAALEQHKRLKSWADLTFVPGIDKWLLERRWEMDLRGQEFTIPPAKERPRCRCGITEVPTHTSPKDGRLVCETCSLREAAEMEA